MNLHLAQDEKFIDFVIADVKKLALLHDNDFIIYTDGDEPLKYVKSAEIKRMNVTHAAWGQLFNKDIRNYSRIFVHYLDSRLFNHLLTVPPEIKIIWCFFGQDGFFLLPKERYLQSSSGKFEKARITHESFKKHGVLYFLLYPLFLFRRFLFVQNRTRRLVKVIRRIDFFGHFIPEDFDLLRNLSRSKMTYVPFTFNALEALQYDNDETLVGDNVLIGNSATITNNHFEVFEKLKKIPLGERKVYCPLSYGDREYAEEVVFRGTEAFGANFVPLQSFLPLIEYKKILHSCGFVFMNHDRSQASDNILINLSSGAKVFMSEKSSLYAYFRHLGITLFTTQRDMDSELLFRPLNRDERIRNRECISDFFGYMAHKERLLKILAI